MLLKPLYDAVVAGAGPAGSTLSARLARVGVAVLLVEASAFEREKAGEFLSPQARAAVNRSQVLRSDWGEPPPAGA
jgi:menaquinone-9 beta-reductase